MALVKAQPPLNNGNVKNEAKAWAQMKPLQMTLEEKVLLLTGKDLWRTNAIPRLGVSRIKTSDGPVGVRGGIFTDRVSKVVDVLLGPTGNNPPPAKYHPMLIFMVCIPRTTLGGRNFEAYGEDPYLMGKIAGEFINRLQDAGIGA
ncbi:hypothetical protein FVER14953_10666 [Fusarium verticillioides]|nr:hypothetical protein FVER14953_10666 [Fusarium verticillioides]